MQRFVRILAFALVFLLQPTGCKPRRSSSQTSAEEGNANKQRMEEILRDLVAIERVFGAFRAVAPLAEPGSNGDTPKNDIQAPASCPSAEAFTNDPMWADQRINMVAKKVSSPHM